MANLNTIFFSQANSPCTDLFLSKVTSRVHGGDKSELLPGNDQLNIIIVSAAFLCQHQRFFSLQHAAQDTQTVTITSDIRCANISTVQKLGDSLFCFILSCCDEEVANL